MLQKLTGISMSISSPSQLLDWSTRLILGNIFIGFILNTSSVDYKTGLPIKKGLFCEKIFGPLNSWKCFCVIYKVYITQLCFRCGNELTNSLVRKYRLGCVQLGLPIFHPWFYTRINPIIPLLCNIKLKKFYNYLYNKHCNFMTINKLNAIKILYNYIKFSNIKFNILQQLYINFTIYYYFDNLNIINLYKNERELSYNSRLNNSFKLNLLNKFYINKLKLIWLFLEILPILPAELRPIIKLSLFTHVISQLNTIYILCINHNNKLIKYKNYTSNISIILELIEKSFLQKSIDNLFKYHKIGTNNTSLIQILIGKFGRFRYNLLGKRIDFSSRSVISSGPDLNFNKLGLPIVLAYTLYKPILTMLLHTNKFLNSILLYSNIKYTTLILQRVITRLFKSNIVIINRAPTLHRINIQAFKPYLIEGYSIKLYPLACSGFNADYDGDQISILLIFTKESRLESKYIFNCEKNIISPVLGNLIYKVNQGIKLGIFNLKVLNIVSIFNIFYFYNTIYDLIYDYNKNLNCITNLIYIKYYNFYILNIINRIILYNLISLNIY